MRDLVPLIKELFEHAKNNKKWLLPVFLAIVILWLLITTSSKTAVPVFVYPLA